MSAEHHDYIICGGGSAGCVLASRLSADPANRVLLIEAGEDVVRGKSEPAGLRDAGARAFMLGRYFWPGLVNEAGEARVPYLAPRVMGGGSSINGMHAQRGLPRDYDGWRALGVHGWGWNDLLPYFKRLENDLDFSGPMHGNEGPIAISRIAPSGWSKLTHALHDALRKEGIPDLQDFNAEEGDGMAPTPLNNEALSRVSTATAYLTDSVRARPNLRIRAGQLVRRILFDGRRASGVEVEGEVLTAREVIVSAGAIHSPTLLLRSGIGAGSLLQRCGIGLVADRPGVGQNLRNHPFFSITCHVRPKGRQHGFRSIRQPVPMIVRYSSGRPGCESTDMVINLWERLPGPLADDPLGRQMAQVMVLLNKSRSKGQVSLDESKPFGSARITGNILSHGDDVGRMVDAFRFVSRLIGSAPISEYVDHYFIDKMAMGQPPDPLTLKLLQDNARARLLSSTASFAMDHVPGVRKKVLATSGPSVEELLRGPDPLPALLQRICNPGGHPLGTCRMGDPSDPEAVIDSSCRVIGVGGLRVVDASIFPTPMTAGTNIPTIMAAERAADLALRERRTTPLAELVAS